MREKERRKRILSMLMAVVMVLTLPLTAVTDRANAAEMGESDDVIAAIKAGPYSLDQANGNTAEALSGPLKNKVEDIVRNSGAGEGVTVTSVTISSAGFQAAKEGTIDTPDGTNGSFTFEVVINKGEEPETVTDLSGTINATKYDGPTQSVLDAIKNKSYIFDQAAVNTESALSEQLKTQIGAITEVSSAGVTVKTVTISAGFQAAKEGTIDTPDGTDGSFSFTVEVEKNGIQQTVTVTGGKITATKYDGPTQSVLNAIKEESYIFDQAIANTETALQGQLKTKISAISAVSSAGVTVKTVTISAGFQAAQKGTIDTPDGTDGSFSFTVEVEKNGIQQTVTVTGGKITATKYDGPTQSVLNAIKDESYIFDQAAANTEAALSEQLKTKISAISAVSSAGVTVKTVTISEGFTPAKEGTPDTPNGTNGEFTFTVTVEKNGIQQTVTVTGGKITATKYDGPTQSVLDAIKGESYIFDQASANTEAALSEQLKTKISAISAVSSAGVTVKTVTISEGFTPAKEGTPDTPNGTNGEFTFTVTVEKNGTSQTVSNIKGTIMATPYTDEDFVNAAKEAIDGASYSFAMKDANTKEAVEAALENQINALPAVSGKGLTINVTVSLINQATEGTADDPESHAGDFTFTVEIKKNDATDSVTKTGTITVEAYSGPTNADAVEDAKTEVEGEGTYTVVQANAGTEEALKSELARQINELLAKGETGVKVEATDITIDSFRAAKEGNADEPNGEEGSFGFFVTLRKESAHTETTLLTGTITATAFTGMTNVAAVSMAKEAIEGCSYTVEQADAGTEEALKATLVKRINALSGVSGAGITVKASDLTIDTFQAAVAGTEDKPDGEDGSFTFTIKLVLGKMEDGVEVKVGRIVSTKVEKPKEETAGGISTAVTSEGKPETSGTSFGTSDAELAAAVLTDEEQQKLANGATVQITLDEKDITASVSEPEQAAVRDAAGDYRIGTYLDVTLIKSIDGNPSTVTQTQQPIRIVFAVPQELRSAGERAFAIVRVHDGAAVFLEDQDSAPDTVTVETDRFSTYAIVYRDETAVTGQTTVTEQTAVTEQTTTQETVTGQTQTSGQLVSPKTGETGNSGLNAVAAAVCLGALASVWRKKERVG